MYVVELKRENIHHGIFFEPIVGEAEWVTQSFKSLSRNLCHNIYSLYSFYIKGGSRHKNVCMMYGESFKFLNKIFQ